MTGRSDSVDYGAQTHSSARPERLPHRPLDWEEGDDFALAIIYHAESEQAFEVPLGSALARGYWVEVPEVAAYADLVAVGSICGAPIFGS